LCLLAGLSLLLTAGISAVNKVAVWRGFPDAVLHVGPILKSLHQAPFGEYIWITLMLLSPLLPTILHLLMVLFALIIPSRGFFREKALSNLEEHHNSKEPANQHLTIPALYFTSSWLLALLVFVTVGWSFWALGSNYIGIAAEKIWWIADATW
jgi:hypothetical protein